jgi:hypothetical protein
MSLASEEQTSKLFFNEASVFEAGVRRVSKEFAGLA